jgi:hypothetical protein
MFVASFILMFIYARRHWQNYLCQEIWFKTKAHCILPMHLKKKRWCSYSLCFVYLSFDSHRSLLHFILPLIASPNVEHNIWSIHYKKTWYYRNCYPNMISIHVFLYRHFLHWIGSSIKSKMIWIDKCNKQLWLSTHARKIKK